MKIREVKAKLVGTGPMSQGKYVSASEHPKGDRETSLAWDQRIWKNKAHYDTQDNMVIPAMALKNMMFDVSKRNNRLIPGQNKKMWNGVFKSGVQCSQPAQLFDADGVQWTRENITRETMLVGSDGKSKNEFTFPTLYTWQAEVEFTIVDEMIDEKTFEDYLTLAGMFIGLGRYRLGRGAIYGGFVVEKVKWS